MSRSCSRPRSSQAGLKKPPLHPQPIVNSPSLGQRSRSLTTLQQAIILQPRMAQLETLEAKMANIEVSLSNSHRRKKNGSIYRTSGMTKDGEIEIRKSVRENSNCLQSMKLIVPGLKLRESHDGNQPFTENEKSQIDTALTTLKNEVNAKKITIKNLKMALDRLDVSDNIDLRIRQAELEFQLGREELNLLTLLEEARALQACLDEAERRFSAPDAHTLHRCVTSFDVPVQLLAVEVEFDPRNPKFGAGPKDKQAGLWVDWALQDSGINEGDRLVEVNGKIVLDKSREDLQRLLSAAPDPAKIVLLRAQKSEGTNQPLESSEEISSLKNELGVVKERAEETQKVKDSLVADNIRLTHRISYLEEQVAELLSWQQKPDDKNHIHSPTYQSTSPIAKQNVTSINISAPPGTIISQNCTSSPAVQVFQKGHLTALVNFNEDRPNSSLSNSRVSTPASNNDIGCKLDNKPRPSKGNTENNSQIQNFEHYFHNKHYDYNRKNGNGSLDNILQNEYGKDFQNWIKDRKKDNKLNHRKLNCHKGIENEDKYSKNSHNDYRNEDNSIIHCENELLQRKERRKTGNYFEKQEKINFENSASVVDDSYRKATEIVQELTSQSSFKTKGHNIRACEKIERSSEDILRHFNSRKSASVADFLNKRNGLRKNFQDYKSIEELDMTNFKITPMKSNAVIDSRSVKSLDFDSDCNSSKSVNNGKNKSNGYTSEPIDNDVRLRWGEKSRPTPPKKPIRLSLHKAQSLQIIDQQISVANNFDNRKPTKRNYHGETQAIEQEPSVITRTSYRINA